MLEFFTNWIYSCSQLCAFWGCDIYRQECHHRVTFGMLANLQLCGIKEGAISSYTSLVAMLFTSSCAEPMSWSVKAMGKNMKPPIPLKKEIERRKGSNDEVLIVPFPLIFNELFASLKSM